MQVKPENLKKNLQESDSESERGSINNDQMDETDFFQYRMPQLRHGELNCFCNLDKQDELFECISCKVLLHLECISKINNVFRQKMCIKCQVHQFYLKRRPQYILDYQFDLKSPMKYSIDFDQHKIVSSRATEIFLNSTITELRVFCLEQNSEMDKFNLQMKKKRPLQINQNDQPKISTVNDLEDANLDDPNKMNSFSAADIENQSNIKKSRKYFNLPYEFQSESKVNNQLVTSNQETNLITDFKRINHRSKSAVKLDESNDNYYGMVALSIQPKNYLDMITLTEQKSKDKFKKILFDYDESGDIECISTKQIDLRDSFTLQLIKTPVRGIQCDHFECFDQDTFDTNISEGAIPYCTFCKRLCYKLEVDKFFEKILKENKEKQERESNEEVFKYVKFKSITEQEFTNNIDEQMIIDTEANRHKIKIETEQSMKRKRENALNNDEISIGQVMFNSSTQAEHVKQEQNNNLYSADELKIIDEMMDFLKPQGLNKYAISIQDYGFDKQSLISSQDNIRSKSRVFKKIFKKEDELEQFFEVIEKQQENNNQSNKD